MLTPCEQQLEELFKEMNKFILERNSFNKEEVAHIRKLCNQIDKLKEEIYANKKRTTNP